MTRQEAERMLEANPEYGGIILRPSTLAKNYALTLRQLTPRSDVSSQPLKCTSDYKIIYKRDHITQIEYLFFSFSFISALYYCILHLASHMTYRKRSVLHNNQITLPKKTIPYLDLCSILLTRTGMQFNLNFVV